MNGSKLIALTLPLEKCIGPLNSLLMTWLWRLLSIGFLGRIHLYFEPEISGSLERYNVHVLLPLLSLEDERVHDEHHG